MKALTVWQPWASLIIAGAKPYEFRGWRFPTSMIGQRLVIHAAKRPLNPDEVQEIWEALEDRPAETCLIVEKAQELLRPLMAARRGSWSAVPLSSGLGTAILGEPRNGFDIATEFGVPRANDSHRDQHANWGWPMLDIEVWPEPIPMRGAQGFWRWPEPEDVLA